MLKDFTYRLHSKIAWKKMHRKADDVLLEEKSAEL